MSQTDNTAQDSTPDYNRRLFRDPPTDQSTMSKSRYMALCMQQIHQEQNPLSVDDMDQFLIDSENRYEEFLRAPSSVNSPPTITRHRQRLQTPRSATASGATPTQSPTYMQQQPFQSSKSKQSNLNSKNNSNTRKKNRNRNQRVKNM